jgi:LysM repeat protein
LKEKQPYIPFLLIQGERRGEMTESTVHEACRLIVSTERQIVPVLERCYELAGRHDCLEEVDELVSIHRHVLDDCHELMAVMGVEDTSALVDITIPDDFGTCIIVIHRHFVRVIDDGYIIIDPRASDPGQKSVLERVTGRKAEQMRLLRRIAEKCGISLSGADDRPPGRPDRPEMPEPPKERTEYVVQQGDTMFSIARKFGIPLEVLIRANPQIRNPDMIMVGEIIIVPRGHREHHPDRRHDHRYDHHEPGRRYVVQQGDTMFLIAQRFAISLSELIAFNPQIQDPNVLVPGQIVHIPKSGGALG